MTWAEPLIHRACASRHGDRVDAAHQASHLADCPGGTGGSTGGRARRARRMGWSWRGRAARTGAALRARQLARRRGRPRRAGARLHERRGGGGGRLAARPRDDRVPVPRAPARDHPQHRHPAALRLLPRARLPARGRVGPQPGRRAGPVRGDHQWRGVGHPHRRSVRRGGRPAHLRDHLPLARPAERPAGVGRAVLERDRQPLPGADRPRAGHGPRTGRHHRCGVLPGSGGVS